MSKNQDGSKKITFLSLKVNKKLDVAQSCKMSHKH